MNTYEVNNNGKIETVEGYNVENALEKLGIPYTKIEQDNRRNPNGKYIVRGGNGNIIWVSWLEKVNKLK